MLAWRPRADPKQLLPMDIVFGVGHIHVRKRNEVSPLANKMNLEAPGNKAMPERGISIRAANYRLEDKRKHCKGFTNASGKARSGTRMWELCYLAGIMYLCQERRLPELFLSFAVGNMVPEQQGGMARHGMIRVAEEGACGGGSRPGQSLVFDREGWKVTWDRLEDRWAACRASSLDGSMVPSM